MFTEGLCDALAIWSEAEVVRNNNISSKEISAMSVVSGTTSCVEVSSGKLAFSSLSGMLIGGLCDTLAVWSEAEVA